jgi:16S rRNA (guanine527-N7)-methyltransferase
VQSADAGARLRAVAGTFGREIDERQVRDLLRYFDLLLAWNQRINLTGARSMEALLSEHLPDSLALDRLTPPGHSLLDVGSGGGLPAIPFAVLRRDVPVTLMEPRSRRAAFLRTALRELALPITVSTSRLEQVTDTFQVLSGRAVLPPLPWVQAAASHTTTSGRIVLYLADTLPFTPPPGFEIADTVRYPAGGRDRQSLALRTTVPRGT